MAYTYFSSVSTLHLYLAHSHWQRFSAP